MILHNVCLILAGKKFRLLIFLILLFLLCISRDVLYPDGNQHSLDTMCGRPYDQCTNRAFMDYLGVNNPAVPITIYINLTTTPIGNYSYYNQSTFTCDEPIISRYENRTACGCLVS